MSNTFAPDYVDVATRVAEFREKTSATTTGCIEWNGKRNRAGYGVIYHAGHEFYAHRVFYTAAHGAVPAVMTIDHLCRNKACVNPDHLEPTTRGENVRRALRKTHCKYGHSMADAYTYGAIRECRPCRLRRSAAERAKRKAVA